MNRYLKLSMPGLAAVAFAIGFSTHSIGWAQTVPSAPRLATEPFVSVGKLIRAGKSRQGSDRFALLDDQGAVSAYVLPTTAAELGGYVNRSVAVTARSMQRGSDSLPYILAQQVSPLDDDVEAKSGAVDLANFETDAQAERALLASADEQPSDQPKANVQANEPRILPAGNESLRNRGEKDREGVTFAALMRESPRSALRAVPAQHEEVISVPPGVPMEGMGEESGMVVDADGIPRYEYGWDVGDPLAGSACSSCNPCGVGCSTCGPWGRRWIRLQYLPWVTKGMSIPPLVTTSAGSTPVQDAGVLGLDSTDVILGNGDILDDVRHGARLQIGTWLDTCQWWGLELDLAGLDQKSDGYSRSSTGSPILARPFYNALINDQDAELVAYPGIVSGTVSVDAESDLYWIAPRLRMNLRCADHLPYPALACTGCNPCGGATCAPAGGYRLDLLVGYRYMRLDDSLRIQEDLTSLRDNVLSEFNLYDSFETENRFSGLELGLAWEAHRGPWSLELLSLFLLGSNRRVVTIDGSTTSSVQGVSFSDPGGLLALSSNMGHYQDDEFVVIPELGATLGYAIAPNLRLLLGYSVLYWGNVVRPGDQIDLQVNPDLLPPEQETMGPAAPSFLLSDTTFWAQGLNVGVDWRW